MSRVFASRYDAGTAFVAKNGFRNDDFTPYLYKTTDYGKTWSAIAGDLPDAPVNVVVQDAEPESAVRRQRRRRVCVVRRRHDWSRLKANLPTVPVQDLLVHPREHDLVLATYGRGLSITNVAPLEQLTAAVLDEPVHLFDVRPATLYTTSGWGNYELYGDRHLATPNEPVGFTVTSYVGTDLGAEVTVAFADP